jgi:hypothetical protein
MAARGEIKPKKGVARLQQGEEYALIGLAAGIGLHIGKRAAEQLTGPFDCQLLGDIDELAPAVIALAGIAFGIFVGHHRALRFQHGAGNDVLGSDELDLIALATELQLHRLEQCRIGISKRC